MKILYFIQYVTVYLQASSKVFLIQLQIQECSLTLAGVCFYKPMLTSAISLSFPRILQTQFEKALRRQNLTFAAIRWA